MMNTIGLVTASDSYIIIMLKCFPLPAPPSSLFLSLSLRTFLLVVSITEWLSSGWLMASLSSSL